MQDRLTYANGNTITTEGFRCSVGEPFDIKVTVGEDEEVELPAAAGKIIPGGDHLITLEVNGEKAAYRDLYHLGEDTVTVGDYTISDDMFLTGVSEDDEVVMRLEPVEVLTTDAFRAAVKKVAPSNSSDSSSGGSGGSPLVVTDTNGTLDKTWTEIKNALLSGGASISYPGFRDGMDGGVATVNGAWLDTVVNKYYCTIGMVGNYAPSYSADSESGYPTRDDG